MNKNYRVIMKGTWMWELQPTTIISNGVNLWRLLFCSKWNVYTKTQRVYLSHLSRYLSFRPTSIVDSFSTNFWRILAKHFLISCIVFFADPKRSLDNGCTVQNSTLCFSIFCAWPFRIELSKISCSTNFCCTYFLSKVHFKA